MDEWKRLLGSHFALHDTGKKLDRDKKLFPGTEEALSWAALHIALLRLPPSLIQASNAQESQSLLGTQEEAAGQSLCITRYGKEA
jgi:hypothetical protein